MMYENRGESYEQERIFGLGTHLHIAAASGCLAMIDVSLSRRVDPSISSSWDNIAVN